MSKKPDSLAEQAHAIHRTMNVVHLPTVSAAKSDEVARKNAQQLAPASALQIVDLGLLMTNPKPTDREIVVLWYSFGSGTALAPGGAKIAGAFGRLADASEYSRIVARDVSDASASPPVVNNSLNSPLPLTTCW